MTRSVVDLSRLVRAANLTTRFEAASLAFRGAASTFEITPSRISLQLRLVAGFSRICTAIAQQFI